MRPEKHRTRARSAALARGRMFLKARLGWLPGFPLAQGEGFVAWLSVPRHGEKGPESVRLERDQIRRATYTWNKLARRFPRALPHLVADRDRWVEGVPQMLDWLKGAIHRGEPIPAALFDVEGVFARSAVARSTALAKRHPALRPFLNALSWVLFLSPKEMPQAVSWAEAHPRALMTMLEQRPGPDGLIVLFTLWELARRDEDRRVAPLLSVVGDPRAFTLPLRGLPTYVEKSVLALRRLAHGKAATALPERPRSRRLAKEVIGWASQLLAQPMTVRRRALDLFQLVWPVEVLEEWQGWWDQVRPLLKQARRLLAVERTEATEAKAEYLGEQLNELRQLHPPLIPLRYLLADIEQAASLEATLRRYIKATLKTLPKVLDGVLVRAAFLHNWLGSTLMQGGHTSALLQAFRGYVSASDDLSKALTPWQEILDAWDRPRPHNRWSLFDTALDELDPPRWPMLFDVLTSCTEACGESLTTRDGERIMTLVRLTDRPDVATHSFLALLEAGLRKPFLREDLLHCALVLDQEAGRFGVLANALHQATWGDLDHPKAVAEAAAHLDTAGWNGLASEVVLEGGVRRLQAVAYHLSLLRLLQEQVLPIPCPPEAKAPSWSHRYPARFVPTLALLAAVTADAEKRTAQVLAKNFPDPADLHREIEGLEKRLAAPTPNPGLEKRLTNLRARLDAPKPVSTARLIRLEAKLERSLRHAVLDEWLERLTHTLHARSLTLLEVTQAPDWLKQPRHLHVALALLTLPRPHRGLALRLLRKRCGAPPWDLIDAPANQGFLVRLRQQGLVLDPWLHPPQPQAYTGANGRTVWIAFEEDPLEIFNMGGHFKTCLSPGGVNFFSVLANAADVNKQVIYARDDHGQVVGRCLLALTDEGRLLTFEPYCHDKALGFNHLITECVETLAEQMETVVSVRGTVSCLVAPDWYDDGPRDLSNRFAFLAPGTAFRRSLKSRSLEDFIAALQEAFAPLPLNALTLPLVLELTELDERPDLVVPLVPFIEESRDLSDDVWLRAAQLASRAGALTFAHRVMRTRAVPHLLASHRRHGWLDTPALTLLIEVEPIAALQVLRRTRPRGIRTDEGETNPDRLALLADAHEALGRTVRARRLRKIVRGKGQ